MPVASAAAFGVAAADVPVALDSGDLPQPPSNRASRTRQPDRAGNAWAGARRAIGSVEDGMTVSLQLGCLRVLAGLLHLFCTARRVHGLQGLFGVGQRLVAASFVDHAEIGRASCRERV